MTVNITELERLWECNDESGKPLPGTDGACVDIHRTDWMPWLCCERVSLQFKLSFYNPSVSVVHVVEEDMYLQCLVTTCIASIRI